MACSVCCRHRPECARSKQVKQASGVHRRVVRGIAWFGGLFTAVDIHSPGCYRLIQKEKRNCSRQVMHQIDPDTLQICGRHYVSHISLSAAMFHQIPLPLRLLGLAASTLAFLLVVYLLVLPALGNTLPVAPFVWAAVAVCLVGCAVLTYRSSSFRHSQVSRTSQSLFVSVAITASVLFIYLVIATLLRGS